MAMNTWLQMVSKEEIEILEKNPTSINKLNKKKEECFSTYYQSSINYFLTGKAYPESSRPLGSLLSGFFTIETETLENRSFGLVNPEEIKNLVFELSKVDLNNIKEKVQDADSEDMEEQEVDDWEILIDRDEKPEDILVSNISKLMEFYTSAEKNGLGIVMYTT